MVMENFEIPGTYNIPGYSNYAISKEGIVFNKLSMNELAGSVNPAGYHNYRLTGDDGHCLTWGLHRLLGYVFKHPNKPIDNIVINHIDGNKRNNSLDNLEWVTEQGNCEHAGLNGLSPKCKPISVRDVKTGIVENYPSIVAYARKINVSKDFVNYRVNLGNGKVFPEGKQYSYTYLNNPWLLDETISTGTCKEVLLRKVLTNEILSFSKLTDLADYLEVSNATVTNWMKFKNQPVLTNFIQLKYKSDPSPWRKVEDPWLELNKFLKCSKVIKVTKENTGEAKLFHSCTECANYMNLTPTNLNYRLKSKGNKVFSDGYKYSYYLD